jgi:hypothetical protein
MNQKYNFMGNKKGINIEDIISLYQEGMTPI